MQAEHQNAILGSSGIQRLSHCAQSRAIGLEWHLERLFVTEQTRLRGDMHSSVDIPEPQVGLRQSLGQGLRAGDGDKAFAAGAAKEDSGVHRSGLKNNVSLLRLEEAQCR